MRGEGVLLIKAQIERFERRLKTARSMDRRARYGKRINSLKAKLTYLTIENS